MGRSTEVIRRLGAGLVALAMAVAMLPTLAAASAQLEQACPVNVPAASFPDVTGSVHADAINCVAWWEVVQGDGHGYYHPAAHVRRDQTASMLTRLLAGVGRAAAPAGDQGFGDLSGNVHAEAVNALAAMGVVRGVSANRFGAGQPVRRDQMASLLVRLHEALFDELPTGAHRFGDIAGNVHAEAIAKLAATRITEGRTPTVFDPAGEASRAEMASFLMRLLDLWLRQDLIAVVSEADPGLRGGDHASFSPSVSASGRYVAFASQAFDLVAGGTGEATQVFVRDRARGVTTTVSVGADGQPANADAGSPSISGDGRQVAFVSHATNLVAGDTNGAADVFVHDLVSGVTTRVSVASDGRQANDHSHDPAISADGHTVAFASRASNLVSGDSNGSTDVFTHDLGSGATRRVSVSSTGVQANAASGPPVISGDGRLVVFDSEASNLVGGDTNGDLDVFVHDRDSASTERISVHGPGQQAEGPSQAPHISPNGRYIAFEALTDASSATGADTATQQTDEPRWDVVRHDRAADRTDMLTAHVGWPSHSPVVADDGRVAFGSRYEGMEHILEWREDPVTGYTFELLSTDDFGGGPANADSYEPAISANGLVVAFTTTATNLTTAPTAGMSNVVAHTWAGGLCMAVLISATNVTEQQLPQRPPGGGEDDEQRCEDRTTDLLLLRAEQVHETMHFIPQRRRTTAAVRARDNQGRCVVVFAGQEDLRPPQVQSLNPLLGEVPARSSPGDHAEVTALKHIRTQGWRPLALGIAPPIRPICYPRYEGEPETCTEYIETEHPPWPPGVITSSRTAFWP